MATLSKQFVCGPKSVVSVSTDIEQASACLSDLILARSGAVSAPTDVER
jgi:hypothetical protein